MTAESATTVRGTTVCGTTVCGTAARVLLVDNYDSYTYNLYQLIGRLTDRPPRVVRNDEVPAPDRVIRDFTHVVVSPGPGHPTDGGDRAAVGGHGGVGGGMRLLRECPLPTLGVCLGHQAIAVACGGTVAEVDARHGRVSKVRHDGRGVFAGVPQSFEAVRYHSLAVTGVPDELEIAATADDGVVMAVRHRARPLHGVQFHPESVGTEHGDLILANFLRTRPAPERITVRPRPRRTPTATLLWREADWRDPEAVFLHRYADRPTVCWLDSARADPGTGRMSYLGAPEGPDAHTLAYRLAEGLVRVRAAGGEHTERGDIFDALRRRLDTSVVDPGDAPFPFRGGYLGYLGYELKNLGTGAPGRHVAQTPDAAFAYVDRFLAFDHDRRRLYAAAVATGERDASALAWLDETIRALGNTPSAAPPRPHPAPPPSAGPPRTGGGAGAARATLPGAEYARAFATMREHLRRGDSYEVNLTYQVYLDIDVDPVPLYRHLRRINPAPYAAFLRLPEVSVLSSSPERFLRLGADGTVEAKPIKGTLPRHPDPDRDRHLRDSLGRDEKTFGENLMITDLIRNDLGQVCQLGTVEVPALMRVESYATVHQLVTTVRGVLRPEVGPVRCVQAAFPPGSMTGAPKLRTMDIIDEVEAGARGVYSGALGYLSLSGEVDLSVVIRTIVRAGGRLSVGVGGGVVALSDPDDERAEAELKASALLTAIDAATGTTGTADQAAPAGRHHVCFSG